LVRGNWDSGVWVVQEQWESGAKVLQEGSSLFLLVCRQRGTEWASSLVFVDHIRIASKKGTSDWFLRKKQKFAPFTMLLKIQNHSFIIHIKTH